MSFLTNLWEKVMAKLGPVAQYIPILAGLIKVKIAEGDVVSIRDHAEQLREAGLALANVGEKIMMAVEDGTITVEEGSSIALALEEAVDEFDDVIKGHND